MHGLQSLADEFATEPFGDEEPRQRVDVLLSIREILRQRYTQESRRRAADSLPDETSSRDRHFLERVVAGHYTDPDFSMSGFASLMAMGEREL